MPAHRIKGVGMKIRTLVVALALAALPLSAPAGAQDARELELARAIVGQGYPPETRMASFGTVMDQIVGQMNQAVSPDLLADPQVMAIVERYQQRILDHGKSVLAQHMDAMMDGMAQGYVQEFTLAELESLHAYVSSPEGRGFFSRSMRVVADPAYARASQGFLDQYMADVPELKNEFIEELTHMLIDRDRASPTES